MMITGRIATFAWFCLLAVLAIGCSPGTPVATTPAPVATPTLPSTTPTPPAPTPPAPPPPAVSVSGHVFTQTNNASANAILVLTPNAGGSLAQTASIPTGGKGSGGGLENQASVALSKDGTLLFATNAGSDDFSVFRVDGASLTLASRTPSGGSVPLSIAEANGIVYVLNDGSRAGATDNISGFKVAPDGTVAPIADSTRALSAASTSAAQVALTPDASLALVTERGTAILDTFALDATGSPGPAIANVSSGSIPFGFQFLDSTHVFISEEGTNAVSSYLLAGDKTVPITRSARNLQGATCWLAIVPSGKFLYTTNTTVGTISAFSIASDGSTALLGDSGVAAHTSGFPIDTIVSQNGNFLYVVNSGGGIDTFTIAPDGSLSLLQTLTNLGSSLNGIVAA